MTDSVLAELFSVLDLVAFERSPDGVFVRVGGAAPPQWFRHFMTDAAQGQPVSIAQVFPFLEHFLVDAEAVWTEGREPRRRSDPFTTTDSAGGEITLVATAVSIGRRPLLVLELPHDFEERRETLQRAREHLLAHEDHVRQTSLLLGPVAAARKLAQQLARGGAAAADREIAAALDDQLAQVSASVQKLAPLPAGISRRLER